MRLLARPKPMPTEALLGYLLRLTEANGYPSITYLLDMMPGAYYRGSVGRMDAAPLADIANLDKEQVAKLTLRPASKPKSFVRLQGYDLPSHFTDVGRCKFCPSCLKDGRILEAFWSLKLAAACPIHAVALEHVCGSCNKNVTWMRGKMAQCRCGAALSETPLRSVSEPLRSLMATLRLALYRDKVLAPGDNAIAVLAHLDLQQLARVIWSLSIVNAGNADHRRRIHSKSISLDDFHDIGSALSNWPDGFQSLLLRRVDPHIASAEIPPSFPKTFNWFFSVLLHGEELGGSYTFMEQELYRFGSRYWTHKMMSRGTKADFSKVPVHWVSRAEAAALTGLHPITIKRMVLSGSIPCRRYTSRDGGNVLIDRRWIDESKNALHSGIEFRDAVALLGISHGALAQARKVGLVCEQHRSKFPGALSRIDIDAFSSRMRGLCCSEKADVSQQRISLRELFVKHCLSAEERVAFYQELLDTRVSLACPRESFEIDRLELSAEVGEQLLRSLNCWRDSLSFQELVPRMGVSVLTLRALRKRGLIKPISLRGRDRTCPESVVKFEVKYESAASVISRLGIGESLINKAIDLSKFDHLLVSQSVTGLFFDRRSMKNTERMLLATAKSGKKFQQSRKAGSLLDPDSATRLFSFSKRCQKRLALFGPSGHKSVACRDARNFKLLEEQLEFAQRQRAIGKSVAQVCREISVCAATYYRWRQKVK